MNDSLRRVFCRTCWAAAVMMPLTAAAVSTTINGPGDAALRAAILAAQPGDTIVVNSSVELQSPIRIDKRLTLRSAPGLEAKKLEGNYEGELFRIAADGVVFEGLRLIGSVQTDGLLIEKDVILRDCV